MLTSTLPGAQPANRAPRSSGFAPLCAQSGGQELRLPAGLMEIQTFPGWHRSRHPPCRRHIGGGVPGGDLGQDRVLHRDTRLRHRPLQRPPLRIRTPGHHNYSPAARGGHLHEWSEGRHPRYGCAVTASAAKLLPPRNHASAHAAAVVSMSPRLASASTRSPAAAASTSSARARPSPPSRAVRRRHLGLDHRHHPAESLDAGPAERAQSLHVVAQPPGFEERTGRIDAGAQRPETSDRLRHPHAKARPRAHLGSFPSTPDPAPTALVPQRSLRRRHCSVAHCPPPRCSPVFPTGPRTQSVHGRPLRFAPPREVPQTFHGARGSRKSRFPPARRRPRPCRNSTASRPEATPPAPMMPASGNALRHSHTAAHGHRVEHRAESPPPPAPSTGRPVSRSSASPRSVLVSVIPSAPPPARRRRWRRCRARSGSA